MFETFLAIDGLHLFYFFPKITHVHISGTQNKHKLKEKHVEINQQLVNRVPISLYTSFVSVDFGEICQTVEQHSDVKIGSQLLLYNFIVYVQQNDILSKE